MRQKSAGALKEVVAELTLENRLLKKSVTADGEDATRKRGLFIYWFSGCDKLCRHQRGSLRQSEARLRIPTEAGH
jgi:hypothetical protein